MQTSADHRLSRITDNGDTPCIRNCCLNEQDICLGCYRTLQEILAWHNASATEKETILAHCQHRRQQRLQR